MTEMKTLTVGGMRYDSFRNQSAANTIIDTLTGSAVSTDMVSPLEHEVLCKIESKNIIPFPYADSSVTKDGITWTVNNDGTIIANGTANAKNGDTSNFLVAKSGTINIPDDAFLSGCPKIPGVSMQIGFSSGYPTDSGSGVFIKNGGSIYYLQIIIKNGTSLNHAVFQPQIEKGNKATPYTRNVPNLEKVKITRCGANLLDSDAALSNSPGTSISNGGLLFRTAAYGQGNIKIPISLPQQIQASFIACIQNLSNNINTIQFYAKYADGSTTESNTLNLSKANETGWVKIVTDRSKELAFIGCYYTDNQPAKLVLSNSAIVLGNYPETKIEGMSYKGEIFTPSANGSVIGIQSISPDMTILTDTTGVMIQCVYHKDTNKVIDELQDRMIQLEDSMHKLRDKSDAI